MAFYNKNYRFVLRRQNKLPVVIVAAVLCLAIFSPLVAKANWLTSLFGQTQPNTADCSGSIDPASYLKEYLGGNLPTGTKLDAATLVANLSQIKTDSGIPYGDVFGLAVAAEKAVNCFKGNQYAQGLKLATQYGGNTAVNKILEAAAGSSLVALPAEVVDFGTQVLRAEINDKAINNVVSNYILAMQECTQLGKSLDVCHQRLIDCSVQAVKTTVPNICDEYFFNVINGDAWLKSPSLNEQIFISPDVPFDQTTFYNGARAIYEQENLNNSTELALAEKNLISNYEKDAEKIVAIPAPQQNVGSLSGLWGTVTNLAQGLASTLTGVINKINTFIGVPRNNSPASIGAAVTNILQSSQSTPKPGAGTPATTSQLTVTQNNQEKTATKQPPVIPPMIPSNAQSSTVATSPPATNVVQTPLASTIDISPLSLEAGIMTEVITHRSNFSPGLRQDDALVAIAEQHSQDMANNGYVSSTDLSGCDVSCRYKKAGYSFSSAGENVSRWLIDKSYYSKLTDYSIIRPDIAKEIVYSWTRNYNDSNNMSNGNFTREGISVVIGNDGYLYTTLDFSVPIQQTQIAQQTNTLSPATSNVDDSKAQAIKTSLDNLDQVRQMMMAEINKIRSDNGLDTLKLNNALNQAAQSHADDMSERSFYSHNTPEGVTPATRAAAAGYPGGIGENIAEGYVSVTDVMTAWMNSSPHRANILSSKYTEIGIGVRTASNSDVTQGKIYWVQDFGGLSQFNYYSSDQSCNRTAISYPQDGGTYSGSIHSITISTDDPNGYYMRGTFWKQPDGTYRTLMLGPLNTPVEGCVNNLTLKNVTGVTTEASFTDFVFIIFKINDLQGAQLTNGYVYDISLQGYFRTPSLTDDGFRQVGKAWEGYLDGTNSPPVNDYAVSKFQLTK